jgi:hypothetical protein
MLIQGNSLCFDLVKRSLKQKEKVNTPNTHNLSESFIRKAEIIFERLRQIKKNKDLKL